VRIQVTKYRVMSSFFDVKSQITRSIEDYYVIVLDMDSYTTKKRMGQYKHTKERSV